MVAIVLCLVLFNLMCFHFYSSVGLNYLVQLRDLSCHLFEKELLTRLITCNFVVCWDVFAHLSL